MLTAQNLPYAGSVRRVFAKGNGPSLGRTQSIRQRHLGHLGLELGCLADPVAGKDKEPPKPVARKVDAALAVPATGGKKFVESYADLLGKGAAALTIAALAGFVASAGLSKELVDAIAQHFKPK